MGLLKKYCLVLTVSCFLISCESNVSVRNSVDIPIGKGGNASNVDKKKNVLFSPRGRYLNLSDLLNACEGYALVIAKSHDDNYKGTYQDLLLIRDANKNIYTYQGSNYNVNKGDTLIVKP